MHAGGLDLSQLDSWNYQHRLHKAIGQLEGAHVLLTAALLRAEKDVG